MYVGLWTCSIVIIIGSKTMYRNDHVYSLDLPITDGRKLL